VRGLPGKDLSIVGQVFTDMRFPYASRSLDQFLAPGILILLLSLSQKWEMP